MSVFAYVRVSTSTQAEHGYGLQAQRDEIAKYAREHDMTIDQWYADEGISANIKVKAGMSNDDDLSSRHALVEMIAMLHENDVVLVLNTSRLWRSVVTQGIVIRELAHAGAIVKSVEQPDFDLYNETPDSYLISTIMSALDNYERMNIALKLARGRSTKAAQGDKPAGRTPYGYRYTSDRKHVEVVESEAKQVKRMFSAAQTGKSLQQIADMLNADGITTRAGNEWCRGSVRAVLKNIFYTGTLVHAGKEIAGNHEKLISRVQYGKVQAQLTQHHK